MLEKTHLCEKEKCHMSIVLKNRKKSASGDECLRACDNVEH